MTEDQPVVLWEPSAERKAQANLTRFIHEVNTRWSAGCSDHPSLYAWSIREPEKFWQSVWSFTGVIGEMGAGPYLADGDKMPGARWFPNARLNFAANLLRQRDHETALVFWGENKVRRKLSFAELYDQVSVTAQALRAMGVKPGDRVAAFMPNMPEAIVALLAATSIGAIWSSCSPDFGAQGVLDRFGQIEPKVLFCVDGYYYSGKTHDTLSRIAEIVRHLPTLEKVVVVPYLIVKPLIGDIPNAVTLGAFTNQFKAAANRVRAGAVQPPALHPLLVWDHRGAKVHRAQHRRHLVAAPEGASAPHRRQTRRPAVLLHHLRLDDVELAGVGARVGRYAAPV